LDRWIGRHADLSTSKLRSGTIRATNVEPGLTDFCLS